LSIIVVIGFARSQSDSSRPARMDNGLKLRHATGIHLLQSGVLFNVIALWLGRVTIALL
jgi:hypothetical protein